MPQFDLEKLEELETRIVPLLHRRSVDVQEIYPMGSLGRGAHSSVFSLLINNEYYVLKYYTRPESFEREIANHRKLHNPPQILLSSRYNDNSLHGDILITKVPEGKEFSSDHLTAAIQNKLASHLIELHRVTRHRQVSVRLLEKRLARTRQAMLKVVGLVAPEKTKEMSAIYDQTETFLERHQSQLAVQKRLVHGDLWWGNIIVAKDDVYLVDWETIRSADYLEDIASLRVMIDHVRLEENRTFWKTKRQIEEADKFFWGIIKHYSNELPDPDIHQRLGFYLMLHSFLKLKSMLPFLDREVIRQRCHYLIEDTPKLWHAARKPYN